MRSPLSLLSGLVVCLLVLATVEASVATTKSLLDDAKAHLAAGRHNEALDSFDAALGQDPANYLTYFRRATVYLSLGRISSAVKDFDKVLSIRPSHHPALLQRAKLLARQGSMDAAVIDLTQYVSLAATDVEAKELLAAYQDAGVQAVEGERLAAAGQHEAAIPHLTVALQSMTHAIPLRALRAQCYLSTNEKEMAIADLTRITKIEPDNTAILMQLARLHLEIGELDGALADVKECLRLDLDHKECKKTFRTVKKLDKAIKAAEEALNKRRYKTAVDKLKVGEPSVISQVEALGPQATGLVQHVYGIMCQAYGENKDNKNVLTWCGKVIDLNGENVDALVYRAEAKLAMEEYEDAMRDFQTASQHGNSQRIQQGHSKAQRLHQQASKKDYYKILGVPRSATKQEIKKAYRKLAQQWHPDKYSGDLPADAVEKKMGELNEAYQTLSDDALRARVDNGEDPNDNNAQNGGGFHHQGGHPFFQQGGGHPFFQQGGGGSPFEFKFNFQ
ncbi:DnaJ sub C member 3 [Thoreauomyces humboldtii]|nr:DnaJ sub C member 3 [Thoreauomyces humboldtii]